MTLCRLYPVYKGKNEHTSIALMTTIVTYYYPTNNTTKHSKLDQLLYLYMPCVWGISYLVTSDLTFHGRPQKDYEVTAEIHQILLSSVL